MKYLKSLIAIVFGLDELPSTANTIGALLGILFISVMLILTTGLLG
jgi:hypothetical protein